MIRHLAEIRQAGPDTWTATIRLGGAPIRADGDSLAEAIANLATEVERLGQPDSTGIVLAAGVPRTGWCEPCALPSLLGYDTVALTPDGASIIGHAAMCMVCGWSPYANGGGA